VTGPGPGRRADVGIRGEAIAAHDDLARAEAGRVIDAAGLTVAPGAFDTHTHAEGALPTDPQHATRRWSSG
jgi:N-acyl-D-aspartate/D-glutamate deacylase